MPLGAFRLNSIGRLIAADAPPTFPTFADGVYFYVNEVPNRNVFAGYDRQVAVFGGNSNTNTIYLAGSYLLNGTNQVYVYPFYFDEANSTFTYGADTFVTTSNGTTILGQRLVSEQDDQPTISNIDTFGTVYAKRSSNFKVVKMDANGVFTVGDLQTLTAYNIGTADNGQDQAYLGIINGKPMYVNGGRSIQQRLYSRNGLTLTEEIIFSGTQSASNRASIRPFDTGGVGLKGWTLYNGHTGAVGATLLLNNSYNIQATTIQGSGLAQGRTVEISDGSTSRLLVAGSNAGLALRMAEIQWFTNQAPVFTYGTIVNVGTTTHTQRTYDVVKSFNNNQAFLLHRNQSTLNQLIFQVVNISGTAISLGTSQALHTFSSDIRNVDATLCVVNNRNYIVGSVRTADNKKHSFVIRIVGNI